VENGEGEGDDDEPNQLLERQHHDTYWMRCSVTVISETYWLSSPLTAWEDVGEKYCVPTTPTEMIHQYNV